MPDLQVFNSPDKVFHVNENDDSEFIIAKVYLNEIQPYVMFLCKVSAGLYRWKGGNIGNIHEWGTSSSKISAIKKLYCVHVGHGSKIEFYIINNFEDLVKIIEAEYV